LAGFDQAWSVDLFKLGGTHMERRAADVEPVEALTAGSEDRDGDAVDVDASVSVAGAIAFLGKFLEGFVEMCAPGVSPGRVGAIDLVKMARRAVSGMATRMARPIADAKSGRRAPTCMVRDTSSVERSTAR